MIDLMSRSDVDAIEVYDNNNSKQMACITARLTKFDSLWENFVEKLINESNSKMANGCK